ncbi:hypothetical protein BC832DRAFT_159710 [Gaertneriomyces semiglobifer]|nr:hypothetical protein BC832DRAFT_159710 [Gaertneriomyces semiglobifer]
MRTRRNVIPNLNDVGNARFPNGTAAKPRRNNKGMVDEMVPLPSFEQKALTDVDNLVKNFRNKFGKKYPPAENDTKANAVHVRGTVLGADGLPLKNFTKKVVNPTLRVKGAPPQDAQMPERRQPGWASPDDANVGDQLVIHWWRRWRLCHVTMGSRPHQI